MKRESQIGRRYELTSNLAPTYIGVIIGPGQPVTVPYHIINNDGIKDTMRYNKTIRFHYPGVKNCFPKTKLVAR